MEFLGVDIGGTNVKWVILNQNKVLIDQGILPTDESHTQSETWKLSIINLIRRMGQVRGQLEISISAPGVTDAENQCILTMPERLKGIEGFNWSQALDRKIHVLNDGHAACLAEYEFQKKSKNIEHMLMLTLGTGVGGGIIINGELFQGAFHRAGHFGHTSIDYSGPKTMTNMVGSLEYAFGNFSIQERTHGKYLSVEELVIAHEKGDTLATYWWLSSIQKLATGLASLINAFSPQVIVLGGGIAAGAGSQLFNPLQEFMDLYEWRPSGDSVPIVQAHYNNYAGAIGAAFFAELKMKR